MSFLTFASLRRLGDAARVIPFGILVTALGLTLAGCATTAPTPTPPTAAPVATAAATPTAAVMPTAIDSFYGTPASYSRPLGNNRQTITLGVSPDFASRPILPFYGLALSDPKFADPLFETITRNHYYRWQEIDWQKRALVSYQEFVQQLQSGQDLSYPVMDTSNGGAGAHVANVNPAANVNILLIPRHDGFVTFPGGPTDPGLSVKNTVNADGSITVRVPIVYAQVITYKAGAPEIQDIVRNSVLLALMELGIPPDAIATNNLRAINDWWETLPEKNVHRTQYTRLQKLLTDPATNKSILYVMDRKP